MIIYLGADHRGFNLKEELKSLLERDYDVRDLGNEKFEPKDDYPDFAARVAEEVSRDQESRGILICGSGAGVDIVANKFDGVRSVLASFPEEAKAAREDDDVNVLAIPADFVSEDMAGEIAFAFLKTEFKENPSHRRRLDKISDLEKNN